MTDWKEVTETEPPKGLVVLWYSPTKGVHIGDRWSAGHFYGVETAFDVTHWAERPKGPEAPVQPNHKLIAKLLASKKGYPYPPGTTLTHSEKVRLAWQRNNAGKPLTYNQAKVLAAIMQNPGLQLRHYAELAWGYANYYTRKRTEAATKGLLLRGLIHHYAACHCGEELCKKGHSYKCKACGSIYAEVYVTFDKIGLVER